jgi:serine phosphatase RsbU (regulator of sigma subunit)/anti-sigma regulatory factor (Ser/Thr protein kinase)
MASSRSGQPTVLGSLQDITDSRQAEQELAEAAVSKQIAEREHSIADELQRSLLPLRSFDLDHLEVATYYRAGVEGTQVGGDWYDVIELGAGRTALVIGDVMGRGVRAASVMGQLRSAVRAYARLDLQPADVLEFLDGIVRELGVDQIVTCVYAVFDPNDRTLTYANAGHLPPLMVVPGGPAITLTGAAGPPLGAGPYTLHEEQVEMKPGSMVVLYTDGLVERRGRDIDHGITALVELLGQAPPPLKDLPKTLADALLPEGPDDDIALLAAVVDAPAATTSVGARFLAEEHAAAAARTLVGDALTTWKVPREVADDLVLMTSELVTNAVRYGKAPIDVRLRRGEGQMILEVDDRTVYRPRKLRPTADDESGRGLEIVSTLADRWGSRSTAHGKSVWAIVATDGRGGRETD